MENANDYYNGSPIPSQVCFIQYLLTFHELKTVTIRGMGTPNINYKSGFVACIGRTNVGKSTLINSLLGQKVTVVSPRPQTTRKRQLGILTIHQEPINAQIAFVDTPGIHIPLNKLGELMNRETEKTLQECDLYLIVVDISNPPEKEDCLIPNLIKSVGRDIPVLIALNKIDKVNETNFQSNQCAFQQILPGIEMIAVSATRGDNLKDLLEKIILNLSIAPPFFPEDQLTDLYEREIAADLLRGVSLNLLQDEVPHGIAVRIDQYIERNEHGAYIEATLFVEKESHKAILIGKNGNMIKKVGIAARKEIEDMSGRKVFLQLKVKVRKNWRNDAKVLRLFGYS